MSIAAIIISFLIILPAELPDKTVIACLVLGSRYRPGYVFAGAAAAFAVQVALAVTAGGLLSLLPHRVTEIIVAVLFVVGAVIMLRQKQASSDEFVAGHQRSRSFLPVALTSFGGLWGAAGLAIVGGRSLLKVLPVKWLSRGAAALLLALAGLTIASLV